MTLAYLNMGTAEIVLLLIMVVSIGAVAQYGKNTILGFWGSLALAILASPLAAFIVIAIIRYRTAHQRH
jgi:hypothetical protein